MILWSLFGKELRENRLKLILLAAAFTAAALIIPLLYEPNRDGVIQFGFLQVTALHIDAYAGGSYSNYVWSLWTARSLAYLAATAAVLFGAGVISGEISGGSALFLLSRPVSRREIYTSKAAAGLFMLAACTAGSTLVLALTSALKGHLLDSTPFLLSVLIAYSGAAVIYLGTAVLSCLLPDPVRTALAAAAIWFLLSVPGHLGPLAAQFSIFYQMKAIPFWLAGANPIVPLGFFLVLAGIFYELGIWLWNRREI